MSFKEFIRKDDCFSIKSLNVIVKIRGELDKLTEAELIKEASKYNARSASKIDIAIARFIKEGA